MKSLILAFTLLASLSALANDGDIIDVSTCVSVYTSSGSEVELCADMKKDSPTTIYSASFKTDKGFLIVSTDTGYEGVNSAKLARELQRVANGGGFTEREVTYVLGLGKRSLEKVSTGELTLEEATRRFAKVLASEG